MSTIIDPHTGQPVQWNGIVDYNQVRGYEQLLKDAGLWDDAWVNSQDWMNMDRASQVAANDQFDAGSLGALGGYQVGSSRNGYTVTDYLIDPQGNVVGTRDRYDEGDSFHSDDYAKMATVIAAGLGTAYAAGDLALAGAGAGGAGAAGGASGAVGSGGAVAGSGAAAGSAGAAGSGAAAAGSAAGSSPWTAMTTTASGGSGAYGSLLNTGLQLGGALYGQYQSNKAADQAAQGMQNGLDLQRYMYDTTRADYAPYRQAGVGALGQIQNLLANPSSITSDPGYQFGLSQGTKALNNGAAAGGMTYSGAQQKALQRYGQDYAGTKLNESYNRLASLAGLGQTATSGTASAGSNYANNGSNLLSGMGNVQAASTYGNGQNWLNALGNIAQYGQQQNLFGNGG